MRNTGNNGIVSHQVVELKAVLMKPRRGCEIRIEIQRRWMADSPFNFLNNMATAVQMLRGHSPRSSPLNVNPILCCRYEDIQVPPLNSGSAVVECDEPSRFERKTEERAL